MTIPRVDRHGVSIRLIVEVWPGCNVIMSVIYMMNCTLWSIYNITPSFCAPRLNHSNITTSLIVVTNQLNHSDVRSSNDNSDAKVFIAQIWQLWCNSYLQLSMEKASVVILLTCCGGVKYSCLHFCWIWAAAPQYSDMLTSCRCQLFDCKPAKALHHILDYHNVEKLFTVSRCSMWEPRHSLMYIHTCIMCGFRDNPRRWLLEIISPALDSPDSIQSNLCSSVWSSEFARSILPGCGLFWSRWSKIRLWHRLTAQKESIF